MIKHNSPVVWQWWSAFSFSLCVCSDIKVTVWHGSLFFLRQSMKTQPDQSNILWQKELIRMCKEHIIIKFNIISVIIIYTIVYILPQCIDLYLHFFYIKFRFCFFNVKPRVCKQFLSLLDKLFHLFNTVAAKTKQNNPATLKKSLNLVYTHFYA